MHLPLAFTAHVIPGSGRGKHLGVPTMNLALEDIPENLSDGIYACTVKRTSDLGRRTSENNQWFSAVMHIGPRPVFQDTRSCEVHVIDDVLLNSPQTITVQIIGFLREVRNFPSPHALIEQMEEDIIAARAMLASHATVSQEHHP
jgi:FAD synthase